MMANQTEATIEQIDYEELAILREQKREFKFTN